MLRQASISSVLVGKIQKVCLQSRYCRFWLVLLFFGSLASLEANKHRPDIWEKRAFKPFLTIKDVTKNSANVGEGANCSTLYIQNSKIFYVTYLRTSLQERLLGLPQLELCLMKLSKATSEAEQKGQCATKHAMYRFAIEAMLVFTRKGNCNKNLSVWF